MSDKIKLCPFCGKGPTYREQHNTLITFKTLHIIGCENDECHFKPSIQKYKTKEYVVKLWNERYDTQLNEETPKEVLKPKYNIDDWVRVSNEMKKYTTYSEMFESMGFNPISSVDGEGLVYKSSFPFGRVFGVNLHSIVGQGYVYGIEYDNKQMLINESGLVLYEPIKGDFFITHTNNNDYINCNGYSILLEGSTNSLEYHPNNQYKVKRPCTPIEKEKLIRAVESLMGKTYSDELGEWVNYVSSEECDIKTPTARGINSTKQRQYNSKEIIGYIEKELDKFIGEKVISPSYIVHIPISYRVVATYIIHLINVYKERGWKNILISPSSDGNTTITLTTF